MTFQTGGSAIVIGGPWPQNVGRVVRIGRACSNRNGHVGFDGLTWYMGPGKTRLVATLGSPLVAGWPPQTARTMNVRPMLEEWLQPLKCDDDDEVSMCRNEEQYKTRNALAKNELEKIRVEP